MFPKHKQSFEVRASSHRISIRDGALLHQNCPGQRKWTTDSLQFLLRNEDVYKCGGYPCVNWIAWKACLLLQYAPKKTCANVNVQIPLMIFGSQSGLWDVSHAVSSSFRRGRIRMLLARLAKQADVTLWALQKKCLRRPPVSWNVQTENMQKAANWGEQDRAWNDSDRVWHLYTVYSFPVFTCVSQGIAPFPCYRAHWSCHWLQALVTAGASAEQVGAQAQAKPEQLCSQLMVSCKYGKYTMCSDHDRWRKIAENTE